MASLDFLGNYTCPMDDKNRVNIPSAIRKAIAPEAESTIVITPGLEGHNLYAYPLDEWKRLTQHLRSLGHFDTSASDFIRSFAGEAYNAKMDSQGRIMLPQYIVEIGKIQKEILIIGTIRKLEIWNPQVLAEYKAKQTKSLKELAQGIQGL